MTLEEGSERLEVLSSASWIHRLTGRFAICEAGPCHFCIEHPISSSGPELRVGVEHQRWNIFWSNAGAFHIHRKLGSKILLVSTHHLKRSIQVNRRLAVWFSAANVEANKIFVPRPITTPSAHLHQRV